MPSAASALDVPTRFHWQRSHNVLQHGHRDNCGFGFDHRLCRATGVIGAYSFVTRCAPRCSGFATLMSISDGQRPWLSGALNPSIIFVKLDRMTDEAQSSSMCARRWWSGFNAPSRGVLGTRAVAERSNAPRNTDKCTARSSPGASGIMQFLSARLPAVTSDVPRAKNRSSGLTYRRAPTGCLPVTRSQASRTAPLICSHADVPRCS